MDDETISTNASLESLPDSVKEDELESHKLNIIKKNDEDDYSLEGFIEFELQSNSTPFHNEESVEAESKNKQLQDKLEEAIQALEISELEKEALKLDSSITKNTLQQMAQEYEDLKLRHSELQKHVIDAEENYSSQISFLQEKIAENQKLKDALSSTAAELTRVQEELGVSQSLTSELVEKLSSKEADFSEELAAKEALESQLKEDISSLASQLGSVKENLNAKVSELDDIKLRLLEESSLRETVQASLKAQEDHVSKVYDEFESTKAALRRSSNEAVEEARSQLRELETRFVAIERRNLELEQQLNLAELKGTEAERKLKELDEEVTDLNSKLTASEEEKSLLTAQLDELKNKMDLLENSLEQSSARNAELELELKDNLVKCGEYEDHANITRQRSLELEDIVQTSYETMEDANKRIRELELLSETEKLRIQEVEDQWEKKYAEAKVELTAYSGMVSALNSELDELKAKSSNLESDLQASGIREDELWNKLKSAEEELELHEKLLDKATLEKSELESSRSLILQDSELKFQEAIKKLNEKDSELEQVSLRLAAMESERIEFQKKIKKAENKILQVSSDDELLLHTNTQLKIRVNEVEELLTSSEEAKIASAKQLISDYEARILRSEQELQEITQKFSIRDTEANELLEKVNILEKKIKAYEAKVDEASALAEIRKAELEESCLKLANAESAVKELKAMFAGSDELKAQILSLSEEKRLLSELYEGVKKELEALKIQLEEILKKKQEKEDVLVAEVISKASEGKDVKSRDAEKPIKKPEVTSSARTLDMQAHPVELSPAVTLKFVLGVALVSVIVGIILGKR